MQKKSSLLIIIAIFIVPIALFYFLKNNVNVQPENVNEIIGSKPVVLDFSSDMCYECKEFEKILIPAKAKFSEKVAFVEVEVNSKENQKLVEKYNVNVVPTVVFLNKDGKTVKKNEGLIPKAELEKDINRISE